MAVAVVLALIWFSAVCGIGAAYIGSKKGETVPGFVAGALLGPLGIILAYVSSGERGNAARSRGLPVEFVPPDNFAG